VPQGDIDEARWADYPQWLQDTIDASPFYRKTKPSEAKAAPKAEPVAPKEQD
jgi:hypothetical protein